MMVRYDSLVGCIRAATYERIESEIKRILNGMEVTILVSPRNCKGIFI